MDDNFAPLLTHLYKREQWAFVRHFDIGSDPAKGRNFWGQVGSVGGEGTERQVPWGSSACHFHPHGQTFHFSSLKQFLLLIFTPVYTPVPSNYLTYLVVLLTLSGLCYSWLVAAIMLRLCLFLLLLVCMSLGWPILLPYRILECIACCFPLYLNGGNCIHPDLYVWLVHPFLMMW